MGDISTMTQIFFSLAQHLVLLAPNPFSAGFAVRHAYADALSVTRRCTYILGNIPSVRSGMLKVCGEARVGSTS
jgi:hypothetical protein